MLGCPQPCGVQITKRSHVKAVEEQIEYLNSVDTTIMGSRNGHAALFLWHSLREKGIAGIRADVEYSMCASPFLYFLFFSLTFPLLSISFLCFPNCLSSAFLSSTLLYFPLCFRFLSFP